MEGGYTFRTTVCVHQEGEDSTHWNCSSRLVNSFDLRPGKSVSGTLLIYFILYFPGVLGYRTSSEPSVPVEGENVTGGWGLDAGSGLVVREKTRG